MCRRARPRSAGFLRCSGLLSLALFLQSVSLVNIGTVAAPEHLRYERAWLSPSTATAGPLCVDLDAEVLSHTASAAHNDLRVYRGYPGSPAQAETPYTLTESGPEPVNDAEIPAKDASRTGDTLHFDLRMPARPYSEVDLHLRLHDFVGTVLVTGAAEHRGPGLAVVGSGTAAAVNPGSFGSFGIFDLSGRGLGAWTILQLAETTAPVLHVTLRLRTPEGKPIHSPPLAVLAGAAVPPSRERQTVYVPVVAGEVQIAGSSSVAVLSVGAHVPVERVRFQLKPGFEANYSREVVLRARTEGDPAAETEVMDAGAIQRVRWAPGDPGLNPINVRRDSVDATTGATLAGRATVRVAVLNGALPPLPIERVTLEMRERRVCVMARAGAVYTLRYGDPYLAAPVYDDAALASSSQPAVLAALGPERRNPLWQPRQDSRPYLDRHPEVFWLVVLLCGGGMGAATLHFAGHREARGRR